MKALELGQVHLRPLEASQEHVSQAAITLTSQALLSGLHIPIAAHNIPVLRSIIAKATPHRLPTRAINAVSTSEREAFDQQFVTTEEKNRQHEFWLGEVASRVLVRSKDSRYASAYSQLFGLPVRHILKSCGEKAAEVDKTIRPSRRSNRLPEEVPPEIAMLVERFKAHVRMKEEKGGTLTAQEQEFLLQEPPSKRLIQTAFAFEEIKAYIHESIYVRFLKRKTDSKGLAKFVLDTYAAAHNGRVSATDVSKKAQLLYEDIDEMTGKGYTMLGLIRAAAVMVSDSRQEEAALLEDTPVSLAQSHVQELGDIIKTQRAYDRAAFGTIFDDVHVFVHRLLATLEHIEEDPKLAALTDTSQHRQQIINWYIRPLFAQPSVFTVDTKGFAHDIGIHVEVLLAQLPQVAKIRSALAALSPSDALKHGVSLIDMVCSSFASDPLQAKIAERYTPDYFLSQTGRVYDNTELIARILWEIPLFRNRMERLMGSHGFLPEELQQIVHSHIERAGRHIFAFDMYGLSLHGPRAETPDDNRDRYLYDPRFNFMMVADGAGDEVGADIAATAAKSACQEILDTLLEKGFRYPYLTQDQARHILAAMVATAANRIAESLPQEIKDYLYGNEAVIDPRTNKPMQPHPDAVDQSFHTTFTAVLPYTENGKTYAAIASVGDSRAYLLKGDGTLRQVTRDDSVVRDYLSSHESSVQVLEGILNRFDGEVPLQASITHELVAVSEAIKREVVELDLETKRQIVADMIDFLSNTLLFTTSSLRAAPDEETKGLLKLQAFLGTHVWDGIGDNGITLDSKVTGIANYFFANRNLVTKFVGIQSGYIRPEDVVTCEVMPGDRFFLTTDGVHDSISEPRFLKAVLSQPTLAQQVDALQQEVLASLGCERVDGEIYYSGANTKSVRAKADDGITVVGEELTSRLLDEENDDEKDTLLIAS